VGTRRQGDARDLKSGEKRAGADGPLVVQALTSDAAAMAMYGVALRESRSGKISGRGKITRWV